MADTKCWFQRSSVGYYWIIISFVSAMQNLFIKSNQTNLSLQHSLVADSRITLNEYVLRIIKKQTDTGQTPVSSAGTGLTPWVTNSIECPAKCKLDETM